VAGKNSGKRDFWLPDCRNQTSRPEQMSVLPTQVLAGHPSGSSDAAHCRLPTCGPESRNGSNQSFCCSFNPHSMTAVRSLSLSLDRRQKQSSIS
jgi:hypothetical protein